MELVIFYQEFVSVIRVTQGSIVHKEFVPITARIMVFAIKPPILVFVTSDTEELIVAKTVQTSVVYTGKI